jgi:hypothetical protein
MRWAAHVEHQRVKNVFTEFLLESPKGRNHLQN